MPTGKTIKLWSILLLLLSQQNHAQNSLQLIVNAPSGNKEIFVSGNFNDWNPGDENYRLVSTGKGRSEIIIKNLQPGEYKYKFTRGNAATFECSSIGTNIPPRSVIIRSDTVINIRISAWSDAWFEFINLPDSLLNEAMMGRAGYYVEINLDSSYKYALELYRLSKKLNLPYKEARALDLQATILARQGNGEKALELLLTSLAIKKKAHDSTGGTSYTYGSIGKIYESAGELSNARENYSNAANWLNKKNEIYKCASYADIGNLYFKEQNIDSATWFANKALALNPVYFGALLLKGDIEAISNRYPAALANYISASNTRGIPGTAQYNNATEAFRRMALVFESMHQKDSAYFYGRKAFDVAASVNNPAAIVNASTVLANLFANDKHYDSAFFYQRLMQQKKDSLFTVEKERQIHNIYLNDQLHKQEISATQERNRAQRNIYLALGLSLLIVLVAIGYRITLKHRFQKQLAGIEMRALRAQMNPHFIFNCLASINRYIVKSDTKTASAYLTKFSKLIRMILDNSANELVSLDAEIKTLRLYMDMELLRFDNAFQYEVELGQLNGIDNTAIPSMIIQPYIENAIWHGLLQRDNDAAIKGRIWMRLLPHTDDSIRIEIEDNGIGRKKAAENQTGNLLKTKSYGMQISQDRIRLIKSQYNLQTSVTVSDLYDESNKPTGTMVTLVLPLIEMASKAGNAEKNIL